MGASATASVGAKPAAGGGLPRPTLVILAAGLASRYGRLKQLDPVGPAGEALMDYAIHDAVRAGFAGIVLVVRTEIEAEVRRHVERIVGGAVPVSFVCQRLDDVPPGVAVPAGRRRPWGTVHAILTAEPAVPGPFAVCNADDFYGRGAYRRLYAHLTAPAGPAAGTAALVGYPLRSTLSRWGGVSRAVCRVDPDGWLERIVEVREVREVGGGRSGADAAGPPRAGPATDGRRITGIAEDGAPMSLDDDVVVSMNLWGFMPSVFRAFRRQFTEFVARRGADPDAELAISTAVNEQIQAGALRLRVLPADDEWFGMTFPEDRADVVRRIAERIAAGEYAEGRG
ncbi:MAG TPA: NTP transferase domain-containing protein [Longimicrobiales bacterium]